LAKRPFPVVNWDVSWICKPLCKSCYLMVCSWPWLITLLIVVSNRWNCSHMKKQFGNVPTTIDQNSYMYRSACLIVRINTVWSLTVCAIMEGQLSLTVNLWWLIHYGLWYFPWWNLQSWKTGIYSDLPYSKSSSVSKCHLDLVFSNI
jgi:hypothetical protein